ncbi:hypothetical protein KM043_012883 [Ampulex compressa]|nr:hypothetical protein KM043_012883 [Ampulex compressa]
MCLDVLDEQPKSKWQKLLMLHGRIMEARLMICTWRRGASRTHRPEVGTGESSTPIYRHFFGLCDLDPQTPSPFTSKLLPGPLSRTISLSWRPNETYRHEQSVNVAGRAKNGYRVKGIMSGSRK